MGFEYADGRYCTAASSAPLPVTQTGARRAPRRLSAPKAIVAATIA